MRIPLPSGRYILLLTSKPFGLGQSDRISDQDTRIVVRNKEHIVQLLS